MTHCPFCGSIVNDMDTFCPVCRGELPDSVFQNNSNQGYTRTSNDDFIEFNQNNSKQYQYPQQYYQQEIPPPIVEDYRPPKKKRSWVRGLYQLLGILLPLILFFAIFQSGLIDDLVNPTAYTVYPESVEFTVKRSTTISCTKGESEYELRIPKPISIKVIDEGNSDYLQKILSVTPSSNHDEINDIYFWNEKIESGESHTISITYRIKALTHQWDIDERDSGTISDIPQNYIDKYSTTENEWLIETTNPDVKKLAKQLTQDKSNVYEKIKAIYDYFQENFGYEVLDREPQTCTRTLQIQRGDCDDQSILFSAMCRSIGIPVWLEFGFIYDKNKNQWGGHGWTTVVIPLKNGNIATPHIDIVNKKFMWQDCYRITEWVDDGNGENLKNYYDYFHSSSKPGTQLTITEPYFNTIELKTFGTVKIPIEL